MHLSNSIPAPGLGGVVPSTKALPGELAGPALNPTAAPTEFALLFAGMAGDTPPAAPPPPPFGFGVLAAATTVADEPAAECGETAEDPAATGDEPDPGEGEPVVPVPAENPAGMPVPVWAVARGLDRADLGAPPPPPASDPDATGTTDLPAPAAEVRRGGAAAPAVPPAWSAGLPGQPSLSPVVVRDQTRPTGQEDDAEAGRDPVAAAKPATTRPAAVPATPATGGSAALAATPAVPAAAAVSPAQPPPAVAGPARPARAAPASAATPAAPATGVGENPLPVETESSEPSPAADLRPDRDLLPPGLALGRNRAEAVAAAALAGTPRPPAPGQARSALAPGAEARTAFRAETSVAAELPAENIAGATTETTGPRSGLVAKSGKSFLNADKEEVKQDEVTLGTGGAKGESAMSLTSFQRRPLSEFVPPVASFNLTSDVGEAARTTGLGETASPARVALRAVNAVAEVKEQIAAGGSSVVNMRFSVAGADLAVRVESRSGEVHVTFRSDSAELRSALAEEWQAVSASEAGRPLRAIDPVFAPAGHSGHEQSEGHAAGDTAMGYERHPDSRHPDDPPVPSQTTHRFSTAPATRAVPALPPRTNSITHQHRLQAFA
jgi:hypothetical protein